MNRKLLVRVLGVIIILIGISLLFINKKVNLEDYKNTSIDNEDKITEIVKELDINYKSIVIDKIDIPYGLRIFLKEELEYYECEKNANKLFYLINDIEFVSFMYDELTYNINNNFTFKNIKEIDSFYKGKYFDEHEYLGRINDYKVFDKSMLCVNEKQLIGTDNKYNYYVFCNNLSNIYLVNEEEITLKDAISKNIVSISDIKNLNIKITEEEI